MKYTLAASVLLFFAFGCSDQQRSGSSATPDAGDNEQVENRGTGKDNWWDELPLPEWAAFERIPVPGDWFEVYRLDDGLYAIYEPGQFELAISFLIVGTDKALLFDTGLGVGDIRAVATVLTDRDVWVLNSHTHYDHVGGNYQFDQILALDTAFTSANAAGRAHAEVAEFVSPGWVWQDFPKNFSRDSYVSKAFEITAHVADGDEIELGGRTLQVLQTPGHAPDALCLLDRQNRLLFTGDSFYLAPLYAHLDGSDVAQYAQTAARLATLADEVDTLVTSHNVPFANSGYLAKLDAAFEKLATGTAEFHLTDGNREYDFGEFSIIVPGP